MAGIGKIQQEIILMLKCYPDRFIELIQVDGEKDQISLSDNDLNDYMFIRPQTLQGLIDKHLVVETESWRKAINCTITRYGLNKHVVYKT